MTGSYHFKSFKACLPQISLGPFLNILSHIFFWFSPSNSDSNGDVDDDDIYDDND